MSKPFRSRQDKRAYHTTVGRIQKRKESRSRFASITEAIFGEAKANPTMQDVKEAARSLLSF